MSQSFVCMRVCFHLYKCMQISMYPHLCCMCVFTGLKEHFGQCGEILRADVLTEVFRVSEIL